jgi:plasmid stability protein
MFYAFMRTTVNIDDHILAEAKVRAAKAHQSLGDVIDDALRHRFAAADRPRVTVLLPTFGVPGERPLVDINDRDAVAEALGDNKWHDQR